jgi:hypothetical protein
VFVEEVLRHLGDACRAFREALPNDLDAWKPAPTLAQEERPRPAPGTASVTPLRPECASEGHRLGEPALAVPAAAMIGNPGQPRLRQTWVAALLTLCAFGAAGWLIYPDAGQGWSALAAVARDLAGAGGRPAGPFP